MLLSVSSMPDTGVGTITLFLLEIPGSESCTLGIKIDVLPFLGRIIFEISSFNLQCKKALSFKQILCADLLIA